jgi:hypothetical protein
MPKLFPDVCFNGSGRKQPDGDDAKNGNWINHLETSSLFALAIRVALPFASLCFAIARRMQPQDFALPPNSLSCWMYHFIPHSQRHSQ